MIETMLVSNNADVCESVEEYERAKFVLLVRSNRREASKQRAGAAAFEVDAAGVEDTPHKSRTIETVWSFSAPAITRAEPLVDCREKCGLIAEKINARRTGRNVQIDQRLRFGFPNRFRFSRHCGERKIVGRARYFVDIAANRRYDASTSL